MEICYSNIGGKKMKKHQSQVFIYFLIASFLIGFPSIPAKAQTGGEDIVIGKSITFTSQILNREMNVLIYLPEGYETSTSTYPVLYDTNSFFCFTYDCGTVELLTRSADIPGMIVVGVPPLQNGYVPTTYEDRAENPTTADLSLKFFKEELIPYIEKTYRTNDFRILYGHSVGGLFTMYALFNYPNLFTAYIAGSPWFQTNNQYWLKNIEKMAKERDLADKFLFMTVGKEEAQLTIDTYKELEKWMNSQSFNGLTWKSAWVDGDHGSMVGRNIYDGLTFIFSGWKIPTTVVRARDVDAIDDYVKTNKAKWGKYGFEKSLIIPESRLNSWGYALIRMKEVDKAIQIFEYTVKLYPKSFNALDSLAEGYLTKGDKEKAIKYYKLAVEINPGDTDYAKRILKNSKDKLKELGAIE
jgi:predicted alpha/beta superfamily hydrolase